MHCLDGAHCLKVYTCRFKTIETIMLSTLRKDYYGNLLPGHSVRQKCSRDLSQQLGNLLRIDASAINRLWHDLQEHVQFVVTNKSSFVKFASSAEGSESKSHSRRFCRPLARISLERVICGPRIEHGQCKLDWGSVTTFSQCLAGHLG